MVAVANEHGEFVGYIHRSDIDMPSSPKEYFAHVNARTLFKVTDADGNVVGYIAPDVPFIPRAQVEAPGFDLEKVRAARNGGCEDQIGDPKFPQEFPPCNDGSGGGD